MIVIVPMAGRGLRFANQGYEFPKWMIRVFDKTILEISLTSVPEDFVDGYVFVVNREQVRNYDVQRLLSGFVKKPFKVVEVNDTEGQAETVYLARGELQPNTPVAIINCDNVVHIPSQWRYLRAAVPVIDAALFSAEALAQKSFALVDVDNRILKTAEKEQISNDVIAGMFYFKSFADYVFTYEQMVKNNVRVNDELYIAPMFNFMDEAYAIHAISFHDLGTPKAVEQFILQQQFMSKEFNFMDSLGIDYTRM